MTYVCNVERKIGAHAPQQRQQVSPTVHAALQKEPLTAPSLADALTKPNTNQSPNPSKGDGVDEEPLLPPSLFN